MTRREGILPQQRSVRHPSTLGADSIFEFGDEHSEIDSDSHSESSLTGNKKKSSKAKSKGSGEPERSSTKDAQSISKAKSYVIAILVISAISVSVAAYFYARKEEIRNFEEAFDMFANGMLETIDLNAHNVASAFEAFGLSVNSLSLVASGDTWPTVTIPNWARQSEQLARQTGSQQVGFMPKVSRSDRSSWEGYSVGAFSISEPDIDSSAVDELPADFIWRQESVSDTTPVPEDRDTSFYYPIWQTRTLQTDGQMPIYDMINRNGNDMDYFEHAIDTLSTITEPVLPVQTQVLYTLTTFNLNSTETTVQTPVTALFTPIMQYSNTTSQVLGVIVAWIEMQNQFTHLLPQGVDGIVLVVETEKNCQDPYSFQINGPTVAYLGPGDMHDSAYHDLAVEGSFDAWSAVNQCGNYTFTIYPSTEFKDSYHSMSPWIYSGISIMIFSVAAVIFILYDWTVERKTEKIELRAAKTDAIVNSLFPANVRDRLIRGDDKSAAAEDSIGFLSREQTPGNGGGFDSSSANMLNNYGANLQQDATGVFTTRPIADLFPEATVMFADIVGFTAWSSTREPSQVFTLLETVYSAFDKIASRRKVFKVETIGDCYVAVAGLPEPRRDHAVCIARFANDCLVRMKEVVQRLEMNLGPDTAELTMRIGLHSGPVTAGVLRGEKSRFQLFGDTVNTAARVESTGERDKIHLSSESAEQLKLFGKGHWVKPRDKPVQAKGKGEMQTYWLIVGQSGHKNQLSRDDQSERSARSRLGNSSVVSGDFVQRPFDQIAKKIVDNRRQRLIGWNVDVLKRQLRQILAHRDPHQIPPGLATIVDDNVLTKFNDSSTKETDGSSNDGSSHRGIPNLEGIHITGSGDEDVAPRSACMLDEVQDIIRLPSEPTEPKIDPYSIELAPEVIAQLTDYVTSIAQMYHDNPFHNFEHASHVTMSVCKLLSRVVTPQASMDYVNLQAKVPNKQGGEELHKYTYGITSDPILQFACALSALIHDVDHPGVPNTVLVQEQAEMATMYNNKSCAEQNSLDLSWGLLMEPQYALLRDCIYRNQEERSRFRQLLVNSVMATDIMDKDLGAQRKARWSKAFATTATPVSKLTADELLEDSNRKATIVIEHLIQASDVSHAMQHWHVYIKWNENLFQELYRAYEDGRSDTDPSVNWYKGEIGFFDYYLIPLAKKLKECGVFGVSSDEYLSYVQANRKEWELKGNEVVAGYLENHRKQQEELTTIDAVGGGTIQEE